MSKVEMLIIIGVVLIIVSFIYFANADLKPNGEYDCGERSANLSIEQERIICENQHYNITGKNITIINGIKTYCCPSPWLPDTATDCNQITYSENWTLSFLRNISAYCSDRGE